MTIVIFTQEMKEQALKVKTTGNEAFRSGGEPRNVPAHTEGFMSWPFIIYRL